jgi:hypothetical protein
LARLRATADPIFLDALTPRREVGDPVATTKIVMKRP